MADNPLQRLDAFELVRLGKTSVTVGGLVAGVLIVGAALIASQLVAAGLQRLRARAAGSAASLYIVEKVVTYGLVLIGFVAGLSTMGLDLTSLAVFAGALGVGVGLGLQGMVKDFASGISLVFERLVAVGDFVELPGGQRGVVQEVGPRATRIRTNDSTDLIVPNSVLVNDLVINWTLRNTNRRIRVPFVTAFGVDKQKVREAVLKAARSVSFTSPDDAVRRTQVWLVGYGEHALKFELIVWPTVEAVRRPAAIFAAYTWAIDDALREAGIEIPYPQRDIRLRGLFGEEGDEALTSLRLEPSTRRRKARAGKAASNNDAAHDLELEDPEDVPPPAPGGRS
ncbi:MULTISPECIES: mechanosensitive ion channel family protein [unclassified Caulobacter]|uniref:mechanosensitive ion channel family protein n=1 Tax=unclassified Caulobacter TaxID=2648921 RepID=UPI000D3A5971|nr:MULTISPECIES: mechanosensitive ion channel domain-containing protein [unclassified Caulobacter]PTS89676.1 transporter [Caulobacter sp. HMWF009]PTT12106.1 transporter [Caulobacter sp. HMWF025]